METGEEWQWSRRIPTGRTPGNRILVRVGVCVLESLREKWWDLLGLNEEDEVLEVLIHGQVLVNKSQC